VKSPKGKSRIISRGEKPIFFTGLNVRRFFSAYGAIIKITVGICCGMGYENIAILITAIWAVKI